MQVCCYVWKSEIDFKCLQCFSLNPELTNLSRPQESSTSASSVLVLQGYVIMLAFYLGAGDLNLDPPNCDAGSWLTKPSS